MREVLIRRKIKEIQREYGYWRLFRGGVYFPPWDVFAPAILRENRGGGDVFICCCHSRQIWDSSATLIGQLAIVTLFGAMLCGIPLSGAYPLKFLLRLSVPRFLLPSFPCVQKPPKSGQAHQPSILLHCPQQITTDIATKYLFPHLAENTKTMKVWKAGEARRSKNV